MSLELVWKPNPPLPGYRRSSQEIFLSCPYREALIEGGRGTGKTTVLLIDFAKEIGKGLGRAWFGVLFRRTYKELEDVIAKTHALFRPAFPGVNWNGSEKFWEWPDGEKLILTYMESPKDYWHYHGWEIPWIGWEELTNWPTLECYDSMMSCNRTSHPQVAKIKRVRATANPWGVGHSVVKKRFIDPAPALTPIVDPETGSARVRVYAPIEENVALHTADPTYLTTTLAGITDESKKKAWGGGADRWNVAAGAYFADVWDSKVHVLDPFEIPPGWKVYRAFDWGSSRPFSVGWYAITNGDDAGNRRFVKDSIIRIAEWYGWNGQPDKGIGMIAAEIGRGIIQREKNFSFKVHTGPADNAIFDTVNANCIADDFGQVGISWNRADKGPGSRVNGWEKCREMLHNATRTPAESPGFYVFNTCVHFIRTIPILGRDDKKPDDIDSSQEDHIADEWRYMLTVPRYGFYKTGLVA
jgi:hypothetical protein